MEIPVGAIFPFYGGENELRDDKYLFVNGQNITKTKFPELYQVLISANPKLRVDNENCLLPNFRGFFLRGLDITGNVDPQRNRLLGSEQGPTTMMPNNVFNAVAGGQHSHPVDIPIDITAQPHFPKPNVAALKAFANQQNILVQTREAGSHTHSISGGDIETRPSNIAVNYIIRAKL